jgi:hypothetical protein
MELSLIGDLNESRMYRTKQAFKKTNARKIADTAFMDLISLYILNNDYAFAPEAIKYAHKTAMSSRFSILQQSQTDLYLSLHVLSANRVDLLTNTNGTDEILLDRMTIRTPSIVRYLRKLASNDISAMDARLALQRAEHDLQISNSNYKSIRRMAQSWDSLTTARKKLIVTRIMMFYRIQAPMSDIFSMMKVYASANHLEMLDASNPESSLTIGNIAAAAAAAAAGGIAGYALGHALGSKLL